MAVPREETPQWYQNGIKHLFGILTHMHKQLLLDGHLSGCQKSSFQSEYCILTLHIHEAEGAKSATKTN
jgi:hypothetical protein